MAADIEALIARLRYLEDVEEIRALKATYCLYCDGGWPQQGGTHRGPVADLFVEDGVWDAGPGLPSAHGRDQIRRLFEELQAIPFAFHPVTNPLIKVDGDSATGHWHLIGAGDMPGAQAGFFLGGYEEDYVRTPDGWRYKTMRVFHARRTELPGGWAASADEPLAPDLDFAANG